ncbi:S41 family peptidase [Patescibacteria group bacterium]|nr:S41 family peptidase [Patescibacteria group bacterium]
MNFLKHLYRQLSVRNIVFAATFFILGVLFVQHTNTGYSGAENENDFDLFWYVYDTLEKKYPFEEPSQKDKMFGAIRGLVDSYGDDYSAFLPPNESTFFTQTISGEFGGIGAEIGVESGYLVVIAPLKNSPAERAGIVAGDIITHVDGVDIAGKTLDGAISLIRGEVGSSVELEIVRFHEEEPLTLTVQRETVHIPIVNTETIEDVFVIHLYNFNESSDKEFEQALVAFKESGSKKLLLDLRNNPGGFLDSAINMASFFLPQGSIVLRERNGTEMEDERLYRSTGKTLLMDYPFDMMVLINGGSASASEILAGALKDHHYATIVGETSFGKGSVQEFLSLPEDTSLKITVAQWLTPDGDQISKKGIEPDTYIPSSNASDVDTQLLQALQLFNNN